jgi:hypothetical protein
MEEIVDEFDCMDDDGTQFTVYVYQDIIPAGHLKDTGRTIGGMKRLELDDGTLLSPIDSNTFTTLSGLILRRIDTD